MARPRVFVSSTYYDLKHVRASLETFISELGYEPVLFENGDIPFHHDKPLDQSCYDAVQHAHIFVLLIGGRYGSSASSHAKLPTQTNQLTEDEIEAQYRFYNSITVEEYRRARIQDLPIYIFLEKGVAAEYQTFKENRAIKIKWAHVDNVGVFHLLDEIYAQVRNNNVKEFDSFSNISSWLRDQWAGLLADFLGKKKTDSVLTDLTTQVETLNQVVDALKSYSEAIVKKVETDPTKSANLIQQVEKKLASEIIITNPFIRYLSSRSDISTDPFLDVDRVISALVRASSVEKFLSLLGLSGGAITRVCSGVLDPATRDLNLMRKKLAELKAYETAFQNSPPIELKSAESNAKAGHGVLGELSDPVPRRKRTPKAATKKPPSKKKI